MTAIAMSESRFVKVLSTLIKSVAVVFCWVVPTLTASAADDFAQQTVRVIPNFASRDVRQVVDALSSVSKKKFVFDSGAKGAVTVSCRDLITVDSFYHAVLEILRVNGFATRIDGDTVYVSRIANSASSAKNSSDAPTNRPVIAVHITSTMNKDAEQLTSKIRSLLSERGAVTEHSAGNILIVSDSKERIERVRKDLGETEPEYVKATNSSPRQQPKVADAVLDGPRLQATFQGSGFVGYRAYSGRKRERFDCTGLQSGDLVKAVAGVLVSRPSEVTKILQAINSGNETKITVERNGQPLEVVSHCGTVQ